MSLSGQIALVTGASRGIGRGIALQLGEAGATVYITGRRPQESDTGKAGLSGLEETAQEITNRGGKGIAVYVDHRDMKEVEQLFDRIDNENHGQLDILVNNAYQAVQAISESIGQRFYNTDPYIWDTINNVGLRNHYFCSVFASRLMVARKQGLIVNIGSAGGLQYLFNVAYGVGKQAVDRLTADTAVELRDQNVTVVSLWPGAVKTELLVGYFADKNSFLSKNATNAEFFATGETTEYAGKAVVAVAADRKKLEKSGRILIAADLGTEYGFVDIDGVTPPNMRSANYILKHLGWNKTASYIPDFVKLPGWLLWASTNRF
ncbi:unnamed protein product [Caenorhabditis sp. 36 PRJEB53466]|nr:unnamed protein product [Caenorhabditis sp. 36 PRJEB53466]